MNKQNLVIAAGLALFSFTTRSEAIQISNYTASSQIERTTRVGSGRAHQCQEGYYDLVRAVKEGQDNDDGSDGGALGRGEVPLTDDAQGGSDPATEQQNTEADSGQEAPSDDSAVAESDADSQETTEVEADDPDSSGDDTEDAADEETADDKDDDEEEG